MIRNNKYRASNHSWPFCGIMFDKFFWDESFHLGKSAINSATINLYIQYPPISTSAMPWRTLPFPICWPTVSKWNAETFFVLYMHVRHRKYHHSKLSQHHSDYPIACAMLCLCYVWVPKLSAITCSKLYLQSLTYSYRQCCQLSTDLIRSLRWQTYSSQTGTLSGSSAWDTSHRDVTRCGFASCLLVAMDWVGYVRTLDAHYPGVMSNDGCYTNLWSLFFWIYYINC